MPLTYTNRFEHERETASKEKQAELNGRKSKRERRQSYADFSQLLPDTDVVQEEEPSLADESDQNVVDCFPFHIRFLKWQESTVGKYIEFKIQITFLEGEHRELAPFAMDDADFTPKPNELVWDVYKRYSDFVTLNDQLLPLLQATGQVAPELPPPIPNETSQRL